MKPVYKRILLKLSGEGLMGDLDFGVSAGVVDDLAGQVKKISEMGVEVCLVVGGGNFFRGASDAAKGMDRVVADQVGMMATVMNGVFIQDALKKKGVNARLMSGLEMPQVCENYIYGKAIGYLERKRVVIFAGGTGNPFFTTDTGAVLRAAEMKVDAVFKATQVDGVYSADPKKDKKAKRFDKISCEEVLSKNLKVMDMAAIALAKENNIPIAVFCQDGKDALVKAVCGEVKSTLIK